MNGLDLVGVGLGDVEAAGGVSGHGGGIEEEKFRCGDAGTGAADLVTGDRRADGGVAGGPDIHLLRVGDEDVTGGIDGDGLGRAELGKRVSMVPPVVRRRMRRLAVSAM